MIARHRRLDAAALIEAVRGGDTLTLARAITAVENRTLLGVDLGLALGGTHTRCRTLGVTGPPGAGKSSLINALIGELLPQYPRIGILTVDPSSPVTGGAVLGDRVRMAAHSANPNLFIRSLAARGHLGGVTRTTRTVIDLLAAAGMQLVIVETVGTGQSEVEIAEVTDVKLMVCAPGLGDEMQAIKAGVLEIADLLVVNKSDLPDADRTANHLKAMLHDRPSDRRSVIKVSTVKRDGLERLAQAIAEEFTARAPQPAALPDPLASLADDVAALAAALVRECGDPPLIALAEDGISGQRSRRGAAVAALGIVAAHAAQSSRPHGVPDV